MSNHLDKVDVAGLEDSSTETIAPEAEKPQDGSNEEEMGDYPTGLRLGAVVFALISGVFLSAIDTVSLTRSKVSSANTSQTIVATAIPRITDQFHSLDQIGWYGSAFFLTLACFQSTWGKVYKFFPMKASFISAIAIFELGSLICGEYYRDT
jgi:hypothetical protein